MSVTCIFTAGPDAGRRLKVLGPVTTIGRGPKNDLVIRDGLVSQYHGELVHRSRNVIYRDLRSRHGTLVKLDRLTVNLHDLKKPQEISLEDGARIMLGDTIIRFDVEAGAQPAESLSPTEATSDEFDERVVRRSRESIDAVTQRLSGHDPRLVSIFRLSRRLNGTSRLDEILKLLHDITFEAFPAANFFAITPLSGATGEGKVTFDAPLIARHRRNELGQPILSTSLLGQVVQSGESVLFVRDRAQIDLSKSIIDAGITACIAAPLMGQRDLIGVMQADTRDTGGLFSSDDLELFSVLASYAAFAIERVRLNENILGMFEGIVRASVKAIDARDPSTAGHSERVATMCVELATRIGATTEGALAEVRLTPYELYELRYSSLLHDFGKIGVREDVLRKRQRLYPGARKALIERFETIKAMYGAELLRIALDGLAAKQRLVSKKDIAGIQTRIDRFAGEMDGVRDWLLERQGDYHLSDDALERIRKVAARRFGSRSGLKRPFITPEELEHLLVPVGNLTVDEWEEIKSHARMSEEYLKQIPWSDELSGIPQIAGQHHEKLDGSGYPNGLSDAAISMQVRILTVCDIFDALTAADRPYRKAIRIHKALEILETEAARGLLDANVVAAFIEMIHEQHMT